MSRLPLLLLNTLTFIGTIYVNYFFASGAGGQETVGEVSDKYLTLITPAGYAFSIWGLIYLLLLGFLIFQWVEFGRGWKNESLEKSGLWFAGSNVLNGLWIVVWTNEWLGLSVLVIFLLLFCLIQLVIRLRLEIWEAPKTVIFFVWWPICIYIGWITLASVVNAAAVLKSSFLSVDVFSEQIWTGVMMGISVMIYLAMTFKRNMREAALVGVWGLSAIAFRHWDTLPELAVAAVAGAGILLAASSYHAFINRKTSPFL